MVDTRTMSELLQAPTKGYGDAIVIPAILAENIELKVGLLTLVTSSQFHGFERDDPYSHIPRIWLEKEPPRSIHTWEDLVSKFVNYFFPPSKTTNLKNDIMNFQQRFYETFSEAWDLFKDLLRKYPHHGFSELHQIDTFYNALTQSDQDSLNAAAGGNLLNRTTRDALTIIENKLKVRTSRNKPVVSKVSATTSSSAPTYLPKIIALTDAIKAMLLQNKTPSPAHFKAMEETCVICGGSHPYYECLATDGNTFNAYAATGTYNQGGHGYRPQGETNYRASNQMRPPGFPQPNMQNNQNQYNQNQGYNQNRGNKFNQGNQNYQAPLNQTQVGTSNDFSNYMRTNDVNMRAMQNQISTMKTELKNEIQTTMMNQNNKLKNMMSSFIQTHSPSGSGSLPSNTIANPRGDLQVITTRSGVSYDGPTIPPTSSPLPKEVEHVPEAIKDKVQTISTAHVQPPVVQVPISEPDVAPKPNPKPSIPYPLRLNDQKLQEKFSSTFKNLLSNKEKLFELANTPLNENCSAVLLKKLPKKLRDPDKSFRSRTPTRMTLELANRSAAYPVGVAKEVFVKVGKFHFLDDFVVVDYDVDPRVPLIFGWPFLRMAQALIDVHGKELTLRVNDESITFNVGHTSRYSYRYDDESVNRINVIGVTCEEYAQEVLGYLDSSKSGNPTPSLDPIITTSSPSLTPFEGGDFVLEEIEACLTSNSISTRIDDADFDPEGDILVLEKFLNDDPSSPPLQKNFILRNLKR
ncbi:reverse transcriptase domain-containing protein [Tanacetum coccineum]